MTTKVLLKKYCIIFYSNQYCIQFVLYILMAIFKIIIYYAIIYIYIYIYINYNITLLIKHNNYIFIIIQRMN